MGHGGGTDLPGDLDHRHRLLGPLGGHGEGIDLPPEDVPLDQEADEAIPHRSAGIDLVMLHGADRHRLGADLGAVIGGGAAGVDEDGVDGEAPLLEVRDAERGVEPATEGEGKGPMLHSA